MITNNISVILATYNGSKYIRQQIDSILNQDLPPEEVIICDDNSSDDTREQLKSYENNKLVKLNFNEKTLGVVENFKYAASLVKPGNWIVFSDQDDIWVPDKIRKLAGSMQLLDNGIAPALVYSDLFLIDKNNRKLPLSFWEKQKIYPQNINFQKLLFGNIVSGCSMIINYPMLAEFYKLKKTIFLHDEWIALVAYSFGQVRFLSDKLVLYRQHESNLTFSENYGPWPFFTQLFDMVGHLFGRKRFLLHQFQLARYFLEVYKNELSNSQIVALEHFIGLEHKNYLLIRYFRRLTFIKN